MELLKRGDEVIFVIDAEVLICKVRIDFLDIIGHGNDYLFYKLGVNPKDFCKKHYGYIPGDGSWPRYKLEDYTALTRTVNALKEIINEKSFVKTY